MNAPQWADFRSRTLTIWDIGVLKLYCVMFGAVVGAYSSSFVQRNVVWFVAGVLVLGGFHGYRWITAQREHD